MLPQQGDFRLIIMLKRVYKNAKRSKEPTSSLAPFVLKAIALVVAKSLFWIR